MRPRFPRARTLLYAALGRASSRRFGTPHPPPHGPASAAGLAHAVGNLRASGGVGWACWGLCRGGIVFAGYGQPCGLSGMDRDPPDLFRILQPLRLAMNHSTCFSVFTISKLLHPVVTRRDKRLVLDTRNVSCEQNYCNQTRFSRGVPPPTYIPTPFLAWGYWRRPYRQSTRPPNLSKRVPF